MENLRVYGVNIGAIVFSAMPAINENLQTIVLLLTILWTAIQIVKTFTDGKD
jgi:hypothetical protein